MEDKHNTKEYNLERRKAFEPGRFKRNLEFFAQQMYPENQRAQKLYILFGLEKYTKDPGLYSGYLFEIQHAYPEYFPEFKDSAFTPELEKRLRLENQANQRIAFPLSEDEINQLAKKSWDAKQKNDSERIKKMWDKIDLDNKANEEQEVNRKKMVSLIGELQKKLAEQKGVEEKVLDVDSLSNYIPPDIEPKEKIAIVEALKLSLETLEEIGYENEENMNAKIAEIFYWAKRLV